MNIVKCIECRDWSPTPLCRDCRTVNELSMWKKLAEYYERRLDVVEKALLNSATALQAVVDTGCTESYLSMKEENEVTQTLTQAKKALNVEILIP